MASCVRKPKRDSPLPVSNFRLRTENCAYLWKNPGYTTGNVMMQVLFLPLLSSIANNKLFQIMYCFEVKGRLTLLRTKRNLLTLPPFLLLRNSIISLLLKFWIFPS